MSRFARVLVWLVLVVGLGIFGWREARRYIDRHPGDFPFTPLALGDPIGRFTPAKLSALQDDPRRCRQLLAAVGDADAAAPAIVSNEPACGAVDAMRLRAEPGQATIAPALVTACPVAAALRLWERERLQPAAQRWLGSRVARIETFGSYSCRRRYNRPDAPWSAHATADAIDISAFVLADGRRVRIVKDWDRTDAAGHFLRAARDGACDLFVVTLSPDYNAAHRDHLHVDMGRAGGYGASLCR